jgi:hypothetical protein
MVPIDLSIMQNRIKEKIKYAQDQLFLMNLLSNTPPPGENTAYIELLIFFGKTSTRWRVCGAVASSVEVSGQFSAPRRVRPKTSNSFLVLSAISQSFEPGTSNVSLPPFKDAGAVPRECPLTGARVDIETNRNGPQRKKTMQERTG